MYTLGVDIGASKTAAALFKNGRMIRFRKNKYKTRDSKDIERVIIQSACSAARNTRVISIGIGVPCPFNVSGKPLQCPNIPSLNPIRVARAIGKIFDAEVFLENDAKAAALAELRYGFGKKARDFTLIAFGTGIGGAVVIGGKIYRGPLGWAGEFGHTILNFRMQKSRIKIAESWESVGTKKFLASRRGRRNAREMAETAALGLLNVIYSLAPEYLVIGGGLSSLWGPAFRSLVTSAVKRQVHIRGLPLPKIVRSGLGERGGVIGASLLPHHRIGIKIR